MQITTSWGRTTNRGLAVRRTLWKVKFVDASAFSILRRSFASSRGRQMGGGGWLSIAGRVPWTLHG
jgi:hypothetical protein